MGARSYGRLSHSRVTTTMYYTLGKPRRKDFRSVSHKVLIHVWGDGYVQCDLYNVNMYGTSHVTHSYVQF
jgi:hypothetical protein